jgi:ribose transport system substrate-binding protein
MDAIKGQGKIAILTGVRGATNLEARINGAKEVLKDYPEVEIAQIYACNDDVPESVRQIQGAMRRHPDLAGWLMVGGWPLFTKGALDAVPESCKVVCVDALPEQWPYLEQKKVEVLVAQKIHGWGAESVKILKGIQAGQQYERYTWSGMDLVTPDTLEQYKQQWQKWFGR